MKHILRFIMIFCCILFGQNNDGWINELPVVERTTRIDTLAGLNYESSGKEITSPLSLIHISEPTRLLSMVYYGLGV